MTYATPPENNLFSQTFWSRTVVYGATFLAAALAWVGLWLIALRHAGSEGVGSLGPGMATFDGIISMMGLSGGSEGFLWNEISHSIVVGYDTASVGLWSVEQASVALMMWFVMAVGMMLPTALPAISTFNDISFTARVKGLPSGSTVIFVAGYLIAWGGLGILATLAQWLLSRSVAAHSALIETMPAIGGVVLVMAGAYQWSALKEACLTQCRSPMRFFLTQWHNGPTGALHMGVRHGFFCVGCCWALMALMFVGGTMNLVWMAILTFVMLLEKIVPRGKMFGRAVGVVLMIWGSGLLLSTVSWS